MVAMDLRFRCGLGQEASLVKAFKNPTPITQAHMVETGIIEWRKMKSRLIKLGKAVG